MSVSAAASSTPVNALGDRLAAELIEVDPLLATDWGVTSGDLPDLDPAWMQERSGVYAAALSQLSGIDVADTESVAAAVIAERARAEIDWLDAGEAFCEVQAALDSPLFRVRQCFEEMAVAVDDDWELIGHRLSQVPRSLAGLRASFEVGRATGLVGARRQVKASADAATRWAGGASGLSAFAELVAPRVDGNDALARQLAHAATAAATAFGEMSEYLRAIYLPAARANDSVGADRFALWSRRYAGSVLVEEHYHWAVEQLAAANADQRALRDELEPADPPVVVYGETEHLRWAEMEIANAIAVTGKSEVLRTDGLPEIVVRPRADGGATPYYSPPSEDGTRAATMWWPGGYGPHEVEYAKTVLFHESVPGHHIESSFQRQATWLNRFQRLVYIPGHSEGWGLYAERLAEEIGLIDTPRARLGCRGSRALRLASLLVDLGIHTGLRPPPSLTEDLGERWTVDGATRLVAAQGVDHDTASWWVSNMVGRPAHRASYAAGERAWLATRQRSTASGESTHDFHHRVLSLGPLGLDQLEDSAP